MAGENPVGWKGRLCAMLCSPPIARLNFDWKLQPMARERSKFEIGAGLCVVLGAARAYLNTKGGLNDMMSGGTDLFSAILLLASTNDCCKMNASILVMFLVWSVVNAVLFELVFSLGPHLVHMKNYTTGPYAKPLLFWADNVLIIVIVVLQLALAKKAKKLLDTALPNWKNQITYGADAPPASADSGMRSAQQPFLAQGGSTSGRAGQPQAGSGSSFRAFGGTGQRLGGGGESSNPWTRPV
eukprot:TRINITY_DN50812_c0_g1_i1.p1 TRINITY_DN50812_c0_g1~~TRINITY_DN50812_c0_g1_i1.p1  ORF type:complete len:241 (+),score=30.45 TRINITY_DN50812_c0_g1_i1:75-797(+)